MNKEHATTKKILLADDDADDRMLFEDALSEVAMLTQLTFANDGIELMSNLEMVTDPPPPHVIFLDLNMPFKNGFECLKHIRENPKLKDIPVVILSTTSSQEAVDQTYQQGANYYICKPRTFQHLVKVIEKVLTTDMWQLPQPPKEKFVLAAA